jgi:hypothetical protein
MDTIVTKPWREDRQIEELLRGESQETLYVRELVLDRKPTIDECFDLIRNLTTELRRLHRELHSNQIEVETLFERMEKLEQQETRGAPEIQRLSSQSRERALKLRSRLGLKGDPMKVDGFAKIRGLLGKYAEENEDPIEFLRRSREEE